MEIGLRIPHTGRQATPDFVRRWSMAADRLGYDSSIDGLRRYEDLGIHSMQVGLRTLDDVERFADKVLPAFR